MINKNDLRYVKTEDLIREAYLSLCFEKKKMPTISLLCERARINKSTFYMHYDCMGSLQRTIGRATIHDLMKDNPNLNRLFYDIEAFVRSLIHIFTEHMSEIRVLFNSDSEVIDCIEQEILDIYIHSETQPALALKLRFCIGGALRLLSYTTDEATVKETVSLLAKVLE